MREFYQVMFAILALLQVLVVFKLANTGRIPMCVGALVLFTLYSSLVIWLMNV